MATLGEVAFILKRLADGYSQQVGNDQARAYHTVLGSYPRLVLVTATAQLMENSKFFPRPSEIVAVAKRINRDYQEPDWAKVDEAMYWYLYTHNLSSTDELTKDDVQKIYQSAGVQLQAVMA